MGERLPRPLLRALGAPICENPLVTIRRMEERMDVSRSTASRLLRQFAEPGAVREAEPAWSVPRLRAARELMASMEEETADSNA